MPVPIHRQPKTEPPPFERCCFCEHHTPYWTSIKSRTPGQQVACCPTCAKTHRVKDVPSKKLWCEADRWSQAQRGKPATVDPAPAIIKQHPRGWWYYDERGATESRPGHWIGPFESPEKATETARALVPDSQKTLTLIEMQMWTQQQVKL